MKTKTFFSLILASLAIAFSFTANAATLNLSTGKIGGSSIANWDNKNVRYWCDDGTTITGTLLIPKQLEIRNDATVTLDNVAINPNGEICSDPIFAGLTCSNATIIIKGENLVRSFSGATACIYVRKGGTLTILEDPATGGSLKVFHDKLISGAAGIGGGGTTWERTAGNIVIKSGTIDATGGAWGGAGIGGGIQGAGCGTITIQGGKITARGGKGSAGIGAGTAYPNLDDTSNTDYAHCGKITIEGGEVEAIGGMTAAGIGGGYLSQCKDIEIKYGTSKVTATRGAGFSEADDAQIEPIGAGHESPLWGSATGEPTIDPNLQELPSDDTGTRIIAMPATVDLETVTSDRVIDDNSLVTGTLNEEHKISIADGATVILEDVHINSAGITNPKSLLAGITCLGDATIILRGANTVRSFSCAHPGIFVPKNKTLTIMGPGSLEARCNVDEDDNGLAAGIGGGYNERCGNIVIDGGTITAVGGMGSAGIGAGVFKKCGNITINGGTVEATGGNGAPGIGGAAGGECGTITVGIGITRVTATAGEGGELLGIQYPAVNPIGPGAYSSCAGVVIDKDLSDSTVGRTRTLEFTGVNLSNISGDKEIANNTMVTGTIPGNQHITIADGATVTLKDVTIDGDDAQGIQCLGDATIIIADGSKNIVRCNGNYSGIYVPENCTLTIVGNDGELTVSSKYGAGIGAGIYNPANVCGNIRIVGGTIVATGGENGAAGIGSAYAGRCGNIDIVGGKVTAIGGSDAAGVGCGAEGKCGDISIGFDNGTELPIDGLFKFESVEARAGDAKYYAAGSPIGLSGAAQSTCGSIKVNHRLQDAPDGLTRIIFISRKSVNLDEDDLGDGETYEPEDGESMTGKTTKKVLLKRNTTVSINGVEVSGAVDAPVFNENEGKTETTEFIQSDDGNSWTLTTFAELSNDSVGSEVEQSQIQVYSAETLEDLDTSAAQVESANVEIVEKKSAVMTTIKVTPPEPTPGVNRRFFKIKYGN